MNRRERKEMGKAEKARYVELRQRVPMKFRTRSKPRPFAITACATKSVGAFFNKKEASLADVLNSGVAPEEYKEKESIAGYANLVDSRKDPLSYKFSDFPSALRRAFGRPLSQSNAASAKTWAAACRDTTSKLPPLTCASRSARGAPSSAANTICFIGIAKGSKDLLAHCIALYVQNLHYCKVMQRFSKPKSGHLYCALRRKR